MNDLIDFKQYKDQTWTNDHTKTMGFIPIKQRDLMIREMSDYYKAMQGPDESVALKRRVAELERQVKSYEDILLK